MYHNYWSPWALEPVVCNEKLVYHNEASACSKEGPAWPKNKINLLKKKKKIPYLPELLRKSEKKKKITKHAKSLDSLDAQQVRIVNIFFDAIGYG